MFMAHSDSSMYMFVRVLSFTCFYRTWIVQVMIKFNSVESLGEHTCCEIDATDCLPSRRLLYVFMLNENT